MAEENNNEVEQEDLQAAGLKSSKMKFIKIGIPVILLQIVIAYVLTAFVIIPNYFDEAVSKAREGVEEEPAPVSDEPGHVYLLEDIIVNPADSRGAQFVAASVAIEVAEEADLLVLETRDARIRHHLLGAIGSHTIDQLDSPTERNPVLDSVNTEIAPMLESGHLRSIYFVSFVVQ